MRSVLIGLAMLAVSGAAFCKEPRWSKEPQAIFGIPIGGTLKADELRDCGGVMNSSGSELISACAIKRPMFGDGVYVIGGFPVQEFTEGAVTQTDGVVESVLLKSRHADYLRVRELLIERYGKPSKEAIATVETSDGRAMKSRVLIWIGSNVTITYAERSGSIDTSSTSFTTTSGIKQIDSDLERKRKSDASKM